MSTDNNSQQSVVGSTDEPGVEMALAILRQQVDVEKEAADSLMRQNWSSERDAFANQHYYAADVLQDAIEQIETFKP